LLLWLAVAGALAPSQSSGAYYHVAFPASTNTGELALAADYTLWVPAEARRIRTVIVHQHGCGAGACQGGRTAAYDLHWQALAAKHHAALLGPSYHQSDSDACQLWSDPRNGSGKAFLNALGEFARQSGHPEITDVPWCLWGHSGGGFWAGEMTSLYPERVAGVWQRSGASALFRPGNEGLETNLPVAVLGVPTVCNPGAKERTDRFERIWTGMHKMFSYYRARGAPVILAVDPRTSHECGESRYLAIPFFDYCLRTRIDSGSGSLKPVDMRTAWYAPIPGTNAFPAKQFTGDLTAATWLPEKAFAFQWQEYVATGAVSDSTPPPGAFNVKTHKAGDGKIEITWNARADLESGIGAFIILRNGQEIGRVPAKGDSRMGRPLFQGLSYHDTPTAPLAEMRFIDDQPLSGKVRYKVVSVNSAGLRR
jgi:hypothetical protein